MASPDFRDDDMTEGSKQPAKYTSDFNGLEKWFTHSIRRLKLSSELIHDITRDDRNPLKCISTRERLKEFASDCTDHSWEKAALDNFDSSGLSQVVVDIKRANGKQISFKKHQVEIDKETFNTAVEALIHLLRLISNLRHGFFSDGAYRSELYGEHKAEHGKEAADEFRYSYIRFHVDLLLEYGLNSETIDKLKEVFELQKFGYLSAADEKAVKQIEVATDQPQQVGGMPGDGNKNPAEEARPAVTEKRLTTTQIRKIATEYNESRTKEHDGYTSDWISSKVKKKIWPEYDQKSSGPKPANWKLNTIKPYLLRDVSFVPAEIWDEKAILHDIRPT